MLPPPHSAMKNIHGVSRDGRTKKNKIKKGTFIPRSHHHHQETRSTHQHSPIASHMIMYNDDHDDELMRERIL
jgi:hypothetical protein